MRTHRTRRSKTAVVSSSIPTFAAAGILSTLAWGGDLTAQAPGTEYRLVPGDATPNQSSGGAVAVRGSIAVVGAYRAGIPGPDAGASYVFERIGNAWNQTARLSGADAAAGDLFGSSVAVDGAGTILVGAVGKDDARGAAYVFERGGGAWNQTARLQASDGQAGDHFGFAAACGEDTMVVGAWGRNGVTGAAYVFERSGGSWSQTAVLVAADGVANDNFGYTVSLSGDRILIGSPTDDGRGSAYLFTRSGGNWIQTGKLVATDGAAGDLFGLSGSVSGDTAVLGARGQDSRGGDAGASYVFRLQAGVWTQTAKLQATDGRTGDVFGHAVAIHGDRILVGAKWRDDGASSAGAAYLFERRVGLWHQIARINASDPGRDHAFGQAVAVDSRSILVGAWGHTGFRGAAYLFHEASPVDPVLSAVVADDSSISAYGGSTRIRVTPRRTDGSLVGGGLVVDLAATAGTLVGSVLDHGDGSYSQELTAAPGPVEIVVSATADGVVLHETATVALVSVSAEASTVAVDPGEVTVGQSATVTVTPRTASGALVGSGLSVSVHTSLGALLGTVADLGDGRYTQQIRSDVHGTAAITATVQGIDLAEGTTLVVQPEILGDVVGFRADGTTMVYRTIQHAVCRARQHEVVRIVVAPGRYDEVVRIHGVDGLRLEADPSLGMTTIRGLRIWGSRNLTVQGFDVDSSGVRCDGISVHWSQGIALRDTLVHGARGAGIRLGFRSTDVLIDRCLVEGNQGDGIRIYRDGNDLRILRTIVRSNGAAGIHLSPRTQVRVEDCQITGNGTAPRRRWFHSDHGYGIYMPRTWCSSRFAKPELVTLIRNTVQGNQGRTISGRSTADFGNHALYIDATDDQAPFQGR